jgi:hypothetical protein
VREILQIVNDYVTTLAAVAAGNISAGAAKVEKGLASAVPVAIGFLANQAGLGNVPEKLVEIIQGLRELVEKALDWLFEQAVKLGKAALNALGVGSGKEGDPKDHPTFAKKAAKTLKTTPLDPKKSTIDGLRAVAQEQEPTLSAQLDQGIGLKFIFTDPKDGDATVKFHVLIAPNDTDVADEYEGFPSPMKSAEGIGEEQKHGSKPPGHWKGPLIHHIQSEHIIPFATARSVHLASGFTERQRKRLASFDNWMITLMMYRGASAAKNTPDNAISAGFESWINNNKLIQKIGRGATLSALGNTDANAEATDAFAQIVAKLELIRADAVSRTNGYIADEWAAKEPGCDKTNGERRAEAAPVPLSDKVEAAAQKQYDSIHNFLEAAVQARDEESADQSASG